MSVYPWIPSHVGWKTVSEPLVLELQRVVKHYVGARDQIQILWGKKPALLTTEPFLQLLSIYF